MKILRIITRLNIGGPAIQAVSLSNALSAPQSTEFQTVLAYGALGEGEASMADWLSLPEDAVELDCLKRELSPIHDLIALGHLYKLIKKEKPDIIHTHTAKAGFIGRLAAILVRFTSGQRPRIVHTYHGHVFAHYFSPLKTKLFLALERFLARFSDQLVTISPTLRKDLIHTYHIGREDNFSVINLGFELEKFKTASSDLRQVHGIKNDDVLIGIVGRLVPIKNHQLFLDAAKIIHAAHPDVHFMIVGDGELHDPLQAIVKDYQLEKVVHFAGWQQDMPAVFSVLDINLITSLNEGTPVNLIEAAAATVCNVATAVGGIPDMIENGETGLLTQLDAKEMATATNKLIENPQERQRLARNGHKYIMANYTFDKLQANIEKLYRSIL